MVHRQIEFSSKIFSKTWETGFLTRNFASKRHYAINAVVVDVDKFLVLLFTEWNYSIFAITTKMFRVKHICDKSCNENLCLLNNKEKKYLLGWKRKTFFSNRKKSGHVSKIALLDLMIPTFMLRMVRFGKSFQRKNWIAEWSKLECQGFNISHYLIYISFSIKYFENGITN